MRVTIITSSYNSASTISETINSVLSQTYGDIEYILVDGKSTDNTLGIIENYKSKISKIICEKDAGIYDALNKGIDAATGDLIGILHSDDFYADENVITDVVAKIKTENSDALYADLQYVDRNDLSKIKRNWVSGKYKHGKFTYGWMPPHPTFFVKKKLYNQLGKYSLQFTTAADYELMLRMIHKHKITLSYLQRVIVKMRTGGVSNITLKNRLRANNEDKKAWQLNGLKPSPLTFLFKPLRKLGQFL